ncbi:MAG TPA: hypothetical protein VMV71_02375 [Candidatus Paceibacterota bacterium]|nr:hypothetical protein [Candidatus Paceibacterota bacterium]
MGAVIHGHTIDGDPIALHYLENLSYEELETIINEARNKGKSGFKHDDRHYEVVRTSSGNYVVARVESGGWF